MLASRSHIGIVGMQDAGHASRQWLLAVPRQTLVCAKGMTAHILQIRYEYIART